MVSVLRDKQAVLLAIFSLPYFVTHILSHHLCDQIFIGCFIQTFGTETVNPLCYHQRCSPLSRGPYPSVREKQLKQKTTEYVYNIFVFSSGKYK